MQSRRSRLLFAFFLAALLAWASGPGFRGRGQLEAHYRKHGSEFGRISKEQYLTLAQTLRDAPAGGNILQGVRSDRVVSKFDKRKGYFGAYNMDRTIRTFFIPNDGERYFHRQAKRQGATND